MLGFLEVEIFPYKVLFKAIRTHILLEKELTKGNDEESVAKAKDAVYNALADGRCFFTNDYHGDSKGFRFYAKSGDKIYQMGDLIKEAKETKFYVLLPVQNAEIRLIRNGEKIAEAEDKSAEFIVEDPGAYRVEVYIYNKAWIYSNHIRVGI